MPVIGLGYLPEFDLREHDRERWPVGPTFSPSAREENVSEGKCVSLFEVSWK